MTCYNCGYMNPSDSLFCTKCGAGLTGSLKSHEAFGCGHNTPYPQTEIEVMPDDTYMQTPMKPKKALAIKITVSLLLILAVGVACFILFGGTPVLGGWYSEDKAMAIVFSEDGSAVLYSLAGAKYGEYKYSRLTAEGSLLLGQAKEFKVQKDTLEYKDAGISFKRADEEFDAEEFIKSSLYGSWSNKELAEAAVIKEDGTVTLYTATGNYEGEYTFSIDEGKGALTYKDAEASFAASAEQIEIGGAGVFVKESRGFDVEAFLEEYGNPLKGAWYDAAGNMGRIDFLDGGAFTLLSYGSIYEGSYKFDNKQDTGKLTVSVKAFDLSLNGEKLYIGLWEFTRELTPQKGKDSFYEQVAGLWYDEAGNKGTLEFFNDGTVQIKSNGESESANCAFNPITGQGVITADVTKQCAQRAFYLSDKKLMLGDTAYVRSYVEQPSSLIEGVWHHKEGTMGTIRFLSGGTAELELAGGRYTGTYVFDEENGEGTVATVFNNREWTFNIRIEGGALVIETGFFIAGDVIYIRESAKQPVS